MLNSYKIVDDIKNGVSYSRTLEQVDAENTYSLGICASAGFAAYAEASVELNGYRGEKF